MPFVLKACMACCPHQHHDHIRHPGGCDLTGTGRGIVFPGRCIYPRRCCGRWRSNMLRIDLGPECRQHADAFGAMVGLRACAVCIAITPIGAACGFLAAVGMYRYSRCRKGRDSRAPKDLNHATPKNSPAVAGYFLNTGVQILRWRTFRGFVGNPFWAPCHGPSMSGRWLGRMPGATLVPPSELRPVASGWPAGETRPGRSNHIRPPESELGTQHPPIPGDRLR